MKLINRFNCPVCFFGKVDVFKIEEFKEENMFCMRAIYKASCNCVLKGDRSEESESEEVAQDVQLSIGRKRRDGEESLAQI